MGTAPRTIELDLELTEGLAPKEALQRYLHAVRVGEAGARVAAYYVAELIDQRTYKGLGFSSLRTFADYTGQGETTLRQYAAVGRALKELPHLDQALADGTLRWTHVRELISVVTPETEAAWVAWAATRTPSQVRRHVVGRPKGSLPTDPAKRRIHTVRQKLGANLDPTEWEIAQRARAKLEAEAGRSVSNKEMLLEAFQVLLRTRPDGSVRGRTPVNDRHYLLHVDHCPGCDGSTTLGDDGERVSIDRETLDRSLPRDGEAESEERPDVERVYPERVLDPRNSGAPAALESRAAPTPAATRQLILERDGHGCRCCGSKSNLTVHHLWFRVFGGPTESGNLVTLCEDCHSLVHARLLFIRGDLKRGLRFANRFGWAVDRVARSLPLAWARSCAPETSGDELTWGSFEWERPAAAYGPIRVEPAGGGEAVAAAGGAAGNAPGPRGEGAAPREESAASLSEFRGQPRLLRRLQVAVEAGRRRGEPLGGLLLSGPPGLGKTRLARAIAAELGGELTRVLAPRLRTPGQLLCELTRMKPGGVLFLDEVHGLPIRAAEVLYEFLDQGVVSLSRDGQRDVRVRLAPFTLICATTDEDQLPRPLLSRLQHERLSYYAQGALEDILDRSAADAGLSLTPAARRRLARASRDTPRQALLLLSAVRDEVAVKGVSAVDMALVEATLDRLGVDAAGLTTLDRDYLAALAQAGRPLGRRALAARLGASEAILERVHEPFLLRRDLIQITPRGRWLTQRGQGQAPGRAA
jgi:Holliday junction DNA helicase RuvB